MWRLLQSQTEQTCIERFHSRGEHLCKFIGTEKRLCKNRVHLLHGRCLDVLGHHYGRRDLMWKRSIHVSPQVLISFFSHRVRTKFAVVDDDFDGQAGRTRVRTKKLAPSSQKADHGKEWKPSKSEIRRQNFDTSIINNNSHRIEGTGQITPLPPPLVSLWSFLLRILHLHVCADSLGVLKHLEGSALGHLVCPFSLL